MELKEEKEIEKLSEVERILKEYGLNESDLEKLKEKKFDEISEQGYEILKSLSIPKEDIENALIKLEQDAKQLISKEHKKPVEPEEQSKKLDHHEVEETSSPSKEIETFLRERSLSRSFITTFLKVGYTEEIHRLLIAMGFTAEETDELQKLWDLEMKGRKEIDSFTSIPSSSDEYLSFDGLYLKNLLSKPLARVLREIISKKPFDPIEYLGHWLLNYKICEERQRKKREFELELLLERERIKSEDEEEVVPIQSEEDEEEGEFVHDWNFQNDE
ncbi:hypothetical protein ANTRET_LOCUS10754 [Anthophora retusa]